MNPTLHKLTKGFVCKKAQSRNKMKVSNVKLLATASAEKFRRNKTFSLKNDP